VPQEISSLQFPKSGGAGEPPYSADSTLGAGSHDVSISKPVVPSSEHSNDVIAESNDNVNDAEKDELGKDGDTASVFSDNDGKTGRQAGRGRKAGKAAGRGNGNGNGKKQTN